MIDPKRILRLPRQWRPIVTATPARGLLPWPHLAVAILSLGIFGQLLQITLTMREFARRQAQTLAAVPIPTSMSRAMRHARALSDTEALDRLLAAHLFGSDADGNDPEPAAAPAQWVLSGVIFGATPETGVAIVGLNGQSTRVRAVGQDVGAGYKLAQVWTDRVTIEGAGRRLSVILPRFRMGGAKLSKATGSGLEGGPAALPKLPPGIWHPPKGAIGVPLPAEALLKPQPHRDRNGSYAGIELSAADATLSYFGLQTADVITEIDGQAITTPNAAQKAMKQLSSGATVMVTVERAGAPMTLPITISEDGS